MSEYVARGYFSGKLGGLFQSQSENPSEFRMK